MTELHTSNEMTKLMQDINHLQQLNQELQKNYQALVKEVKQLSDTQTYCLEEQLSMKFTNDISLTAKIRRFFKPKLGILIQYLPRPLVIPANYHDVISLTSTPTVSIVTPSYNQGEYLEKTILSVKEQNYPAIEYIIQDGGSSDNSVDIMKKHQDSIKHWESKPDQGQSNAINLGFKHATGDIMAYLNSDDILLPGTLAYVVDYFNKHPDVDVVYGHRILIDKNDLEIGRWIVPQHDKKVLTWADYIPQETLFWRRSIWEKAGGKIDENFRFAMDWDLLLRLQEAGAKFARLPRFLGAFRVHTMQKTSSNIAQTGEQEMAALRMRCHGRQVTQKEVSRHVRFYLLKHVMYQKLYRFGLLSY